MIERYIQFLGLEQTINYLEANERPLTPSIRTNTLKISPSDLKIKLEKKGFELEPIEWVPYAFKVLKAPYNLGSSHEFLQGYYYLQNIASMLPAIVLNPKSADTVIDIAISLLPNTNDIKVAIMSKPMVHGSACTTSSSTRPGNEANE